MVLRVEARIESFSHQIHAGDRVAGIGVDDGLADTCRYGVGKRGWFGVGDNDMGVHEGALDLVSYQ
ncbi:hypothetical protein D3C72_2005550 [compost metagenome]